MAKKQVSDGIYLFKTEEGEDAFWSCFESLEDALDSMNTKDQILFYVEKKALTRLGRKIVGVEGFHEGLKSS